MDETIEVWTAAASGDVKAALPTLGRQHIEVTEVQVSDLTQNLGYLIAEVQLALEKAAEAASAYTVDEIELNIGVNAKGGVALIGKMEAGMTAGIKVKLKRRTP